MGAGRAAAAAGAGQDRAAAADPLAAASASRNHGCRFEVVTPDTARLYRCLLPDAVLVHLLVPLPEARRRAGTRVVHLTAAEFEALHAADRDAPPPPADHRLDAGGLSLDEQVAAIEGLWRRTALERRTT